MPQLPWGSREVTPVERKALARGIPLAKPASAKQEKFVQCLTRSAQPISEAVGRSHGACPVVCHHDRAVHEVATDTINPLGVCCRNGMDKSGRYVNMRTGLRLDDGTQADGRSIGSCHKCMLACGATWLNIASSKETVPR